MEGLYIIFAGTLIIALIAFIISYREDHPKKVRKP
jgi:hypothetical protein